MLFIICHKLKSQLCHLGILSIGIACLSKINNLFFQLAVQEPIEKLSLNVFFAIRRYAVKNITMLVKRTALRDR